MFKLLKKTHAEPIRIGPQEITVGKTGFGFGKDCLTVLNKEYVELHIDKEDNRIGFKSTDNKLIGFKLSKKCNSFRICSTCSKEISFGKYPVIIKDDMVIINNVNFKK